MAICNRFGVGDWVWCGSSLADMAAVALDVRLATDNWRSRTLEVRGVITCGKSAGN